MNLLQSSEHISHRLQHCVSNRDNRHYGRSVPTATIGIMAGVQIANWILRLVCHCCVVAVTVLRRQGEDQTDVRFRVLCDCDVLTLSRIAAKHILGTSFDAHLENRRLLGHLDVRKKIDNTSCA